MRRRFSVRRYRRKRVASTVLFVAVVFFVIAVIAYGAFKGKKFVVRRCRTAMRADWRRFVAPPPRRYRLAGVEEETSPNYRRANDLVSAAFGAVDAATPPSPEHIPILRDAVASLQEAYRLLKAEGTERATAAARDVRRKIGEAQYKLAVIHFKLALKAYQEAGLGVFEDQQKLRLAFSQLKECRSLLLQAKKDYQNGSVAQLEKEMNQILYDVQKRLSFR